MNNLNNNENLIRLFNNLFKNENLANKAPIIMKYFIITRNYGLINFEENINKLMNNANFSELAISTIKNGFKKDNIQFDNNNLVSFLITNYHANGFYFHSFPGIYKDSISQNGILATKRNENDEKYFKIADKYHFGEYFKSANNRVCVSEKIGIPFTHEYAIFTPEWLEMFLKQGNRDIHSTLANGDINEIKNIVQNSLNVFHIGMQRNPQYNENDYIFLCDYINDVVNKRFSNGNDIIGIALIEKEKSDDYFKKHIQKNDILMFEDYINSRKMDKSQIFDFIIEVLSNGEKKSDKSIPSNLINIISYQIKKTELEHHKTI